MVINLTQQDFSDQIASGITLVDFWAGWCRPCKMIAPVVEQIADEMEGKARVAKVDVDAEGALAMKYGVMSIPMLILFKDGEVVDKIVGVVPKNEIIEMIERA